LSSWVSYAGWAATGLTRRGRNALRNSLPPQLGQALSLAVAVLSSWTPPQFEQT